MTTAIANDSPTDAKRILFVDDEHYVLDGMRDALRPYRHQWDMRFVASGQDALDVLGTDPHDVIVSDLRMPGMDGASLLERVRDLCLTAVRIVLSGHAALRLVAGAAGVAHRFL